MRRALTCLAVLFAASAALAQGPVVTPNENLVLDGLPPIPAAIAEAVGRYTEARAAGFASWHPTRREMLISTRFADTNQVHWVKMPGGARTQMTFFPERVGAASFPRRSGAYFVFTRDVGGNEFGQVYRYDVATADVTLVSDGGRSQNSLGPFSHAGDRMAYGSTRRNGADRDIYVVDPADPNSGRRVLEVQGGGWAAAAWSPDDASLLLVEGISINESYLWLLDLASGGKRLLTPKGKDKVAYGGARFAADGRRIFATTDRDSEFRRLAAIDLATGAHTYLTSHIPWDVDSWDLSDDGALIAFATNEGGLSVLRVLDTATGSERPRPQLGLGVGLIAGIEWRPASHELAFTFASARAVSDVYSLDADTGRVERWTYSETGGLNPAQLQDAERIAWRSFDGREISGFLFMPPARFAGPRPVIVDIHGGPEGQSRPSFQGRKNYLLNELGIAIVYPNVRGSTGFGKTFSQLDNWEKREDSVKDVGALLDWIAARPDLDAGRVMVTGGSYGGYMTLAVAAHYNDRIRCSLDVVGISNFVTFLERTEAYRRDLRRVEYGDERDPKVREFLERIAPLNNAAKIRKPIFIVQGRNDPRVPVTEAEQMVAQLKRQGTPVWYLVANDEGHGFAKKKNADFLFYATVAFIRQHLLAP
jgi:dipeptidyl aminopeptidase/acylaminoacyl peptidase